MSLQDLKNEAERLPPQDRKSLAAFLVSLSHRDSASYRQELTRRIDDHDPARWVSPEELDRRLAR